MLFSASGFDVSARGKHFCQLYRDTNGLVIDLSIDHLSCSLEYWSFEMVVLLSGLLPNPQLETSVLSVRYVLQKAFLSVDKY